MLVACFGHTIDPYFISKKYQDNLLIILPNYSEFLINKYKNFKVAIIDFPKNKLIEDFSDDELLLINSTKNVIISHKVTHFLISHRSLKEVFYNCKLLCIKPIGNHYHLASKLENKRFFDNLLKNLKINKPQKISIKNIKNIFTPFVLQEVSSFGSFGTKIYKQKSDLPIKLNSKYLDNSKYLARKFIKSNVFGVTLISHKNGNIFSGIRQQCYYNTEKANPVFAGIQWIPTKFFDQAVIKQIELSLKKISKYLKKISFTGIVHFDFLIDENSNVYFLECNPRPSSATPQLLKNKALIHGIDISSAILGDFKNLPNKDFIPNHNYTGSLLDIMKISRVNYNFNNLTKNYFYSFNRRISANKLNFFGCFITDSTLFKKNSEPNSKAKKLYFKTTGYLLTN
jgi:hypothetical protein